MGICYEIKMKDDFNWGYVGTSKKEKLKAFCKEFKEASGIRPIKIADWYGNVIYDLDKKPPYIKEYGEIILKYCDTCHYWGDCQDEELRELKRESLM